MYVSFISSMPEVEEVEVGPSVDVGIVGGQEDEVVQVVVGVQVAVQDVEDVQVVHKVHGVVGDQLTKMKLR